MEEIEKQTRLLVDMLQKEISANVILKKEIASLKEESTWRKYPDQKPDKANYYLVANVKSVHFNELAWYSKDEDWFHERARATALEVTHWVSLPKKPAKDN